MTEKIPSQRVEGYDGGPLTLNEARKVAENIGTFHYLGTGSSYWPWVRCGVPVVSLKNSLSPREGVMTKRGMYGPENPSYQHGEAAGGKTTRLYSIWVGMRQRCNSPKKHGHQRYGGRGITVCPRWDSFLAFKVDMGDPPSKRHSIERRDNSRGYEPGNCYWATPAQQANNRRNNRMIEFKGRTKTLSQWAAEVGIKPSTIRERINGGGWTIELALTVPVRSKRASPR